MTSLREIAILKTISHENIIKLEEVVVGWKQESVFLCFEFCAIDLANLVNLMLENSLQTKALSYFSYGEIKCIFLQIVKAVKHLHDNNIVHRDLKLSNLLLTKEGTLKLADFGLARQVIAEQPDCSNLAEQVLTPKLVTLWYRAPEILLRCPSYGLKSDVWALGCILAELLNNGYPILPGRNEIDQYIKICDFLGKPSQSDWPAFSDLPQFAHIQELSQNLRNNVGE